MQVLYVLKYYRRAMLMTSLEGNILIYVPYYLFYGKYFQDFTSVHNVTFLSTGYVVTLHGHNYYIADLRQ